MPKEIRNQPIVEAKISIISSCVCRICYDNDKDEPLITPCQCKGTVAFVHCSCLEKWLAESNTAMCELCNEPFQIERTLKYSVLESIWYWIKKKPSPGQRGVRSDMFACTIITPLAIIVTYVCLFASDYYNQKKFDSFPPARWTSISLLIMIMIMLIGYYLWVYSVIRLHSRMWFNWWQSEFVIKFIPNVTINFENLESGDNSPIDNASRNDETEETISELSALNDEEYIRNQEKKNASIKESYL